MLCCIEELREKDVINVCDGENLGYVDDVRVDTQTHTIEALILYGKPRFLDGLEREKSLRFLLQGYNLWEKM